jgi:hypothetical protein
MKLLKEKGVTYYIIGSDYDGCNKDEFKELINLGTLYENDIVVMYDWNNGLCLIEDQETLEGLEIQPLSALFLTKLLTDDKVIEWMTRSGEEDRLYA